MDTSKENKDCCTQTNCCDCSCLNTKQVAKLLRHVADFFDKE
jgi:hypothetical protein